MELIALAGNPFRRRKLQIETCFVWICLVQIGKVCFGRWGGGNHYLIQRSKQRYSNMLWNMRSITRHKRSYGHPLHPDLTPDVLTCVLPLGTVSSGRESEVESSHLFLTIIQFFSACHLTSQHTSTCIHNSIISHSPTHYKSPVAMGEWRSSRCRIHWKL